MRTVRRTTHADFGSFTCDLSRSDSARLRGDSAVRRRSSSFTSAVRLAPAVASQLPLSGTPQTAVLAAPTLASGALLDGPTAALTERYRPLLQSWWQAAHAALDTGVLTAEEILDQNFAAMQRVMGLALLESMQRRWQAGCGPCGALILPHQDLLPDKTLQALQSVHAFVVTRPSSVRAALIPSLMQQTRALIIAGQNATDLRTRDTRPDPKAPEALAVKLFYAATESALSERTTQTALLGVFWKMLEGYICARNATAGPAA